MKRQVQSTGVRDWYGEDYLSLQEEPLKVLDGFFGGFGNYIISGCNITPNGNKFDISPGLVALEGVGQDGNPIKIVAPFEGITAVSLPVYLSLSGSTEEDQYNDGGMKPIAYSYKAVATNLQPDGSHIEITEGGAPRFTDKVQDPSHRFITDEEREQWNAPKKIPSIFPVSETIVVDEIPRREGTYPTTHGHRNYVIASLNRPRNYTFFSQADIFLPLLELKWRTGKGATSITSKTHLEQDATFEVDQTEGVTSLDVYSPIRQCESVRTIVCTFPAADGLVGKLIEYNTDGEIIRERSAIFGRGQFVLLDETTAIRFMVQVEGVGWQGSAIYVCPEVWKQYLAIKETGLYRMGANGCYEGIGTANYHKIIAKNHKTIATREAGAGYAISPYVKSVEPFVNINYGAVVQNPSDAVTIAAGARTHIGVFVKMRVRRSRSKRKRPGPAHNHSFQKWCLYTGKNWSGGVRPFPGATAYGERSKENRRYFRKLSIDPTSKPIRHIRYIECAVAFIEYKHLGWMKSPVGTGVRFIIRNRKAEDSADGSREWVVERA